jgi:hypothetical protein
MDRWDGQRPSTIEELYSSSKIFSLSLSVDFDILTSTLNWNSPADALRPVYILHDQFVVVQNDEYIL